MTKGKRGLGRGLGAFFGDEVVESVTKEESTAYVAEQKERKKSAQKKITEDPDTGKEITLKIGRIEPNADQPRKEFREDLLQELADSIRQYGVLQPLLVQKKGDMYEIIAGERRWRAAKLAGLKEVPVVIREYSAQQTVEIALIENVQREDLNPIEEALAYRRLIQEFNLKQEEIAARVAKNRTTITNSMRLLKLEEEVQKMLISGQISSGHARALLGVEKADQQIALAKKVVEMRLSVRETEKAVKQLSEAPKEKKKKETDKALELVFQELEDRMKSVMGTKVNINRKDKSKGRIEIEYYSEEELERIVDLIESIR
jgi:ParB family chromosome partitioning protein